MELSRLQANAAQRPLLQAELNDLQARWDDLAARSLPRDPSSGQSAYAHWLTEIVNRPDVKLAAADVHAMDAAPDKDFTRLRFVVRGRGAYTQVVRLLENFYAADHLHKITSLRLAPIKDSRDFDVTMAVEALSLRHSRQEKTLATRPNSELKPNELQAHVKQLLSRNLYRANRPPQLGVRREELATVGRGVSVSLAGSDPDRDGLTYELLKGPDWLVLEGSTLRSKPGSSPPLGAHEVTVKVRDDGAPPREEQRTFTVRIAPPPEIKKPPQFDHGRFAFLDAVFELGGVREVWITLRTLDRRVELREGQSFDDRAAPGLKFTVVRIDVATQTAIVEYGGQRRLVQLGQSLAAASPAPTVRPASDTAARADAP
jgi:hypothetical protein